MGGCLLGVISGGPVGAASDDRWPTAPSNTGLDVIHLGWHRAQQPQVSGRETGWWRWRSRWLELWSKCGRVRAGLLGVGILLYRGHWLHVSPSPALAFKSVRRRATTALWDPWRDTLAVVVVIVAVAGVEVVDAVVVAVLVCTLDWHHQIGGAVYCRGLVLIWKNGQGDFWLWPAVRQFLQGWLLKPGRQQIDLLLLLLQLIHNFVFVCPPGQLVVARLLQQLLLPVLLLHRNRGLQTVAAHVSLTARGDERGGKLWLEVRAAQGKRGRERGGQ